MSKLNISKFVAALRSNKYHQGCFKLCVGNAYCIMGVACEVAIQDGIKIETRYLDNNHKIYDGSTSYVPQKVIEWLGIDSVEIDVFIRLNDSHEYSFEQLADIIEKRYND